MATFCFSHPLSFFISHVSILEIFKRALIASYFFLISVIGAPSKIRG
jgi:hypothetical protein